MRRFELHRAEDVSGSSGTGRIAEGVMASDGSVALRWIGAPPYSWCIYEEIEDVTQIHGHEGRAAVLWIDVDGE